MNTTSYPNLELLEYKAQDALIKQADFQAAWERKKENHGWVALEMDAYVFPQIWGSTNCGFDLTKNGGAAIGGCAMTKEYTTVFHENITDSYIVFFGEIMAYRVTEPTEAFFEDLRVRNLAAISVAKMRY